MTEQKLKRIEGGVTYPKGFAAYGIHCGLRKNTSKRDLAMIVADVPCSAAAIYFAVSSRWAAVPPDMTTECAMRPVSSAAVISFLTRVSIFPPVYITIHIKYTTTFLSCKQ